MDCLVLDSERRLNNCAFIMIKKKWSRKKTLFCVEARGIRNPRKSARKKLTCFHWVHQSAHRESVNVKSAQQPGSIDRPKADLYKNLSSFCWGDPLYYLYYLVAHISSLSLVWGDYPLHSFSRAMRVARVRSFRAPNAYHYYESAASDVGDFRSHTDKNMFYPTQFISRSHPHPTLPFLWDRTDS